MLYNAMLTSLLYRVNTCLRKTTTCNGLRAEQIFSVNIYTYVSILGVAFTLPFICYFQKLKLLDIKKSEIIFAALYFYIYELKKCLRFLKSYFNLEILFLFFVVFFLVDMFK